jgi:hypothetical protein
MIVYTDHHEPDYPYRIIKSYLNENGAYLYIHDPYYDDADDAGTLLKSLLKRYSE